MSWFREASNKASHTRNRESFDESLAEEIRLHIEERTEELRNTGMPEKQASEQARREFGNAAHAAEQSREAWRWTWMEDLARDLRHALRALRKERGFAITAILSLALGIGLNTTIFSLTSEFLFSQPSVRDPATLMAAQFGGSTQLPFREYKFVRDAAIFAGLAGENPMQEVNWRTGESSLRLFVTRVTENYFDVAGVPLAQGRGIATNERNVAVVSHRFWRSRLGGKDAVLGSVLILDGVPHTVVGLLPRGHRTLVGFGYAPDLYLPLPNENTSVSAFGRLPADQNAAGMRERMKTVAADLDRIYPDAATRRIDRVSLTSLVGTERLGQGFLTTVAAFFALMLGVSALLLLIACANVASLLLARASARAQEFAIRMSIGAGRSRLIRQLLAESLLISLLGTAAGLLMNYGLTRVMNRLEVALPFPVQLAITPDWRLLLYASVISIAAAVAAGLLPALKATRGGSNAMLKSGEHQVGGRATVRNLLVAGQLAVSVVVLIIAALSIRNLVAAATLDPGFDLRQTAWAQMRLVPEAYPEPARARAFVAATLEQVQALPGIASATVAFFVPLNDHFATRTRTIYSEATRNGLRLEHSWNAVGPDYLRTMGIPLIAGREFNVLDREGSQPVLIVNEAFARQVFGGANPIGRTIRFGRDDQNEKTIVGVARNSKYSTIGEKDRPAVYEAFLQVGAARGNLNFLVRSSGPPQELLKPLSAALLSADPAASIDVKPMSGATAFALLPSRMGAGLLGTAGVLGLALASVGLYGVLAYSISRRTREIGLRMALGAQRGQVLRLVLREGAWILGLGLAAGGVISVLITRPLVRFLVPGLQPTDPASYLLVAVVLVAVGFAAGLRPAARALRIDPLRALRYE